MIIGKYSGALHETKSQKVRQTVKPDVVDKPLCQHCGLDLVHANDRCETCYAYFRKHGMERPFILIERAMERRTRPKWCVNCGDTRIFRLGRCNACCKYLRLNHKERPKYLWNTDACCLTCGYPKRAMKCNRQGRKQFIRGRCVTCYDYKRRYSKDRPRYLWGIGKHGWCECGRPANYKKDGFNLCTICAEE